MLDRTRGKAGLMASPQWPAPMITVVVLGTAATPCLPGPDQPTLTVTLVGLVMMS